MGNQRLTESVVRARNFYDMLREFYFILCDNYVNHTFTII